MSNSPPTRTLTEFKPASLQMHSNAPGTNRGREAVG
jgi:hypothetical protein